MSREEIVSILNGILEVDFEIDPSLLKPDALLREDLDLDSLDAVDLIVAIEKRFGFRVNEGEARSIITLSHIYESIERHIERLHERIGPDTDLSGGGSLHLDHALET